jgi:leucyl aminopeptidase
MRSLALVSALALCVALTPAMPVVAQTSTTFQSGARNAAAVSFVGGAAPSSGAVAIAVTGTSLSGPAADIDRATNGALRRAIGASGFKGGVGEVLNLYGLGPYSRILLMGLPASPSRTTWEDLGGRAAGQADGPMTLILPSSTGAEAASHVALGARLGSYDFGRWGAGASAGGASIAIHTADPNAARQTWTSQWSPLADGVTLTRDLISTPSNIKSPQWFVDEVRRAFQGVSNVTITVIDEKEAARLGMGALLGVGQGSTRPPRLLAVSYRGAGNAAPLAFVGKGITFDSGGISIKPGDGMWRMRYDMSGAAASVGAVMVAAKRNARVNVVGVAALAENMPDGGATRPGDVLRSISGKTMEILNTDAEGRIVLADANWWTQETYKPSLMVNIATLTGSARGALGDDYGALFANSDAVAQRVAAAGAAVGEETWRLPIHPSTVDDIRSRVADVRNVVEGGAPGASIGAAFLQEWVKPGQDWAHLDIAGVAWRDSGAPTIPPGAVGWGVELFDQLTRNAEAPAR